MKKSNITFVIAILVAIHALIVMALISGPEKDDKKPAAPAKQEVIRLDSEIEIPEFKIPELTILEPIPVIKPAAKPTPRPPTTTASPVTKPAESIATPGNREGYLRSDRPNRRTSKIYSRLVGNPYAGSIVVDARTGKILYENKAHSYAYPASVTKLMTMLIVLEEVDAGRISLSDKVKITQEVAEIGGSGVYLDPRESGEYTVHQMLEALMIHSANDAARALALHVAGTRDAFVDMMNKKARELGMNSTTYHSEHGLPPEVGKQPDISTAYDIALLSLAALRHPKTIEYTGTKLSWLPTNNLRKDKFMLANRNALIGKEKYPGCDGLKTGYHKIGGWSLAATAEQDGNRVVSVILGAPDKVTRNTETRKLLDKGFETLKK